MSARSTAATARRLRDGLVVLLRVALYGALFALLLQRCTGDGAAATTATAAQDPTERQLECFENTPPLFYDQAGTCYAEDPTLLLTPEQRALAMIVPTARGGPAPPPGQPVPPRPPALVDPRTPGADPPPVLAATGPGGVNGSAPASGGAAAPTGADGAAGDGTTTQVQPQGPGTTDPGTVGQGPTGGQGATGPTSATATVGGPTSPSLGYIAEDGRTDDVREGPEINGIRVWVHDASRTLYADSCEVLQTITVQGQEFGPTAQAPGFSSICPQL